MKLRALVEYTVYNKCTYNTTLIYLQLCDIHFER
jgi:hypothetical protein